MTTILTWSEIRRKKFQKKKIFYLNIEWNNTKWKLQIPRRARLFKSNAMNGNYSKKSKLGFNRKKSGLNFSRIKKNHVKNLIEHWCSVYTKISVFKCDKLFGGEIQCRAFQEQNSIHNSCSIFNLVSPNVNGNGSSHEITFNLWCIRMRWPFVAFIWLLTLMEIVSAKFISIAVRKRH